MTTYVSGTWVHTLTTANDSIVSGKTYSFMFRSKNVVGYSEYSNEAKFAIAIPPAKPAIPVKLFAESGRTFITVQWQESADTEIPIMGYDL